MEKLQKINNEVTFLYSMLGDKHTELNESMAQLNDLILECQAAQAQTEAAKQLYRELQNCPVQDDAANEADKVSDEADEEKQPEELEKQPGLETVEDTDDVVRANVREKILERYRAGEDLKDVARDLGLGFGEVKLIVELYKGEENQ